MKRLIALLSAGLLLLTSCASQQTAPGSSPASGGKELETVDVVLDWYPNAVHAFIYQAIDKGYFADEGLQVNVLFPANTSDPISMTAVGKADIGFITRRTPSSPRPTRMSR